MLSYQQYRKIKSGFMSALTVGCAVIVVTPLVLILYHLLREGFGALDWNFFTKLPQPPGVEGGGMANAIIGTFVLITLAMVIALPIGLLGAIYLSEYGSPRINFFIRFGADVLNGIPSIVWGMMAYAIVVVPFKGFSSYAGGLALGFIAIPLILRTTEEVLILVPNAYREAAMALGIPRWKIIYNIVVRTALKGIITGILLAVGRIAGETAPLLFTAFGNNNWSQKLSEPIASLPLQVFTYAISPYDDWHRQAWAGALVLIFLVFLLSTGVRFFSSGRRVK